MVLGVVHRAGRLSLTTKRTDEYRRTALGPWTVRFAEKNSSHPLTIRTSYCPRLPFNGCVAGPRGVIPASATASPGYTPDVWDDIVGPVGFLQQFENKLFEMDESRVSSSASQPQPENSAGELKATAVPIATDYNC
jgi:hypothetical protein